MYPLGLWGSVFSTLASTAPCAESMPAISVKLVTAFNSAPGLESEESQSPVVEPPNCGATRPNTATYANALATTQVRHLTRAMHSALRGTQHFVKVRTSFRATNIADLMPPDHRGGGGAADGTQSACVYHGRSWTIPCCVHVIAVAKLALVQGSALPVARR